MCAHATTAALAGATFHTPSQQTSGSCRQPYTPAPSTCALVVTVKFNGKVIAERTTMQVGMASSWESVARTRLEAVLPPETVADYMGAGLKVHLFESAAHLTTQRVAAQISDPVSGGFTLGFAHVPHQRRQAAGITAPQLRTKITIISIKDIIFAPTVPTELQEKAYMD